MSDARLTVALISEVYFGPDGAERLGQRLVEARDRGAELAMLPELPCNSWSPATKHARDEDAEQPDGPRTRLQAEAACSAGIGLVGGVIEIDPADGCRRNTAVVFDAGGRVVARYRKLHLPEEPGFWETSHYVAGTEPPTVVTDFPMPIGLQICSDLNRPEGCHLLGAAGAEVIIAPRGTESSTFDRWRMVIRANALTSGVYVLSVNRPQQEQGVPIGGPSIVAGPDGGVMLETTDPLAVVTLARDMVRRSARSYPGYLPVRADLYARAWSCATAAATATGPGTLDGGAR